MKNSRKELAEEIDKILEDCVSKDESTSYYAIGKLVGLIDKELGRTKTKCFSIHCQYFEEPVGYTHSTSENGARWQLEDDNTVKEIKKKDCSSCNREQ